MHPPRIEKGVSYDTDAPNHAPPGNPVNGSAYRQDTRSASHLIIHRLDSKPEPELWEEALEARVSLMAQEAAEATRECEYLRTRLALSEAENEMHRKLCRCRRWTK